MSPNKCNEKSEILRADGNKFYAQKMFYEALQKYNESLCFAIPESKNVGLSYANRSAVYFELKLSDRCLANIELAWKNHYPEENLDVLKKREEKCKQIVKMQKSQMDDFIKLSHPPRKKLPFVAECLEVKCSEKFGRHIVTNRSLKVGDIVAIEEPFCCIIHESYIYQKCTGCFKDNLFDLLPCHTCCRGKRMLSRFIFNVCSFSHLYLKGMAIFSKEVRLQFQEITVSSARQCDVTF